MWFKRNQIEEAISRTIGEDSAKPSSRLSGRIKRLLNHDRNSVRSGPRAPKRPTFAFYDGDPPGRGVEVMFSEFNGQALYLAIRMMAHGWPQNFVVSILRECRGELSKRYEVALTTALGQMTQTKPRAGELALSHPLSSFLLIISDEKAVNSDRKSPYVRFFNDQTAAFEFQKEKAGRCCSWLELDGPALNLHRNLTASLPIPRGRGA